ncbi:hypothetical protein EDD16DRAFT_1539457 [Pisolithus croceorrhizus]|nr:hypothetical protein EDD16DRAFT_1539457 [Pisolithus croceorrhizus]
MSFEVDTLLVVRLLFGTSARIAASSLLHYTGLVDEGVDDRLRISSSRSKRDMIADFCPSEVYASSRRTIALSWSAQCLCDS